MILSSRPRRNRKVTTLKAPFKGIDWTLTAVSNPVQSSSLAIAKIGRVRPVNAISTLGEAGR